MFEDEIEEEDVKGQTVYLWWLSRWQLHFKLFPQAHFPLCNPDVRVGSEWGGVEVDYLYFTWLYYTWDLERALEWVCEDIMFEYTKHILLFNFWLENLDFVAFAGFCIYKHLPNFIILLPLRINVFFSTQPSNPKQHMHWKYHSHIVPNDYDH